MKKIKSYIVALFAATALSAGLSSCQDDVDAPAAVVPEAGIEANTTILELKQRFWSEDKNYADSIHDPADANRRFIIKGHVISSDKEGNIFKSIVIQDETAALAFSVDSYNLYLNYRRGQEVVIDVTGMTIGKYAGLQQIGHKSWYANGKTWQVSFMPFQEFKEKVELNGMPEYSSIDTLVANTFADIPNDTESVRKYQSQLVRFKNVYFADGGQKTFSVYHTKENEDQNRTLVDREGNTRIVRTSGYATWCEKRLPAGVIDLVGIMSYYNDTWQIMMLDYEGVMEAVEMPGSKEKPYDVPGAISEINSGIAVNGWVKGYIVGAVAPEVESVTGNGDIEWTAPTVLASTLVIAPDPSCKEISECLVVQLPSDSPFRAIGNLRDNPGNLGKPILVKGDFVKFMNTPGLTGNSGKADEFEIEGVEVPTIDGPAMTIMSTEMTVPGTTDKAPYTFVLDGGSNSKNAPVLHANTSAVRMYAGNTLTISGAGLKTIKFTLSSDAKYRYTTFTPTTGAFSPAQATGDTECTWVGNADTVTFTVGDNASLGTESDQKGQFRFVKIEINGGSGDTPTPPGPGSDPSGEGTEASPYNVAKAMKVIEALGADVESEEVYVSGVISAIKEISTGFGNATYSITDEGGSTELGVFRGYWLGGEKFTSENQIKVGAKVVVKGKLINFMGNTPEFAQGNELVSYDGETGGDTPTPPTPDDPDPAKPGEAVNFDLTPFKGSEPNGSNYNVVSPVTENGYTITIDKASGATAPAYNEYNGAGTLRLYADNTFTIEGAAIAKIVFSINTATGTKRYTTFTPDTGSVGTQAAGDESITWTGNAGKVTFTVGHDATLGSDGASKRGQVHINKIEIYPAE